MVLLMHSGVFIGSCDVIGMEFKGEVGLLPRVLVMYFTLTSVKIVCVCVRACVRASVCPPFFSVTATTLSVKHGHIIK